MRQYLIVLILFSLSMGCQEHKNNDINAAFINESTIVTLDTNNTNKLVCIVSDSITSVWPLNYPVYQYKYGDIDHNGTIDLAVGVLKATRYDSVKRNRLFLFQVRNNTIIPLWLGTSVGHPIVDFRVLQDSKGEYFVRILGAEKNKKYLVADYVWYGFGLTLSNYVKRETTIEIAKEILYNHI